MAARKLAVAEENGLWESNIARVHQRLLTAKPLPVEDDAPLISEIFLRGLTSK